jgi:hypothetical protein
MPGRLLWLLLLLPALLALFWVGGPFALGLLAGGFQALCDAGLLLVFGSSLLPGREPLVTGIARRLNPHFHDGMRGYTRGVTWAWCLLFAAELIAWAALVAWAPQALPAFAGFGHALPILALAFGEYALRRHRFGAHGTHWRVMLAAFRRGELTRPAAGAPPARAGAAGSPAADAGA